MHDDRVPAKNAGPDLLAKMDYEHRDIALQKLMWFITVFIIGFLAAMLITVGIYQFFIPNWAKLGKIPEPSPYRRLPPHPQVQVDPRRDMALYRLAEDKQTSGEQGAVAGTKPAMTVTAAIEKLAAQDGIAGITGTAEAKRGEYFPGSRAFDGKPPAAGHSTGGDHAAPAEGVTPPTGGAEHSSSTGH